MRSPLQIQASRLNSQKSTGPRTAAGKAISCLNPLTTGIYAQAEIITGENPNHLAALAAEYFDRFQPDAPEQRALIDTLVHSEWTLRRLRRAVNYDESKVFSRLQRRIDATQRNYQRALKQLQ
jgi:hypothetical protein